MSLCSDKEKLFFPVKKMFIEIRLWNQMMYAFRVSHSVWGEGMGGGGGGPQPIIFFETPPPIKIDSPHGAPTPTPTLHIKIKPFPSEMKICP